MRQLYQESYIHNLLSKMKRLRVFFFAMLLSVQVLAQYNVTVTTDGNAANQLRGAIVAANAAGGTSTIIVAAGTYNLTMGEISFGTKPQNITITGAGSALTIINMTATAQDRIFLINPPGTNADIQTTITGITFTGGHSTTDLFFGGGAIGCGGPNNSTIINNCVFNNNTSAAGQNGGAIYMSGGGSLSLNQCTFTNNVCPTGAGGALYYFKNNSINGVDLSGSLSVTNCIFNNNSVTASGSSGGAIEIGVQGIAGSTTSSISILRNTFINNNANVSGNGGAISITNSFSSTNTAFINYNRFFGNTATNNSTSALAMSVTQGSVDATNNWWGCNVGATACSDKAAMLGAPVGGTLNTNPWLQLSTTAGSTSICSGASGNTSVITASFLRNSAGTTLLASNLTAFTGLPVIFSAVLGTLSGAQAIQSTGTATVTYTSNGTAGNGSVNAVVDGVPASEVSPARATLTVNATPVINTAPTAATSCTGNTASFTVAASGGTPTYQWFKGAAQLNNGASGTGSTIAGATAATLNIQNASSADNASDYRVVITNAACQTSSANVSLTITPLTFASATATGTGTITSTNTGINNASCQRIVNVLPSGGVPVNGNITATVTVDGSQPSYNGQPYVIRHYDITPVTNPNSATATITLYFLQSEFDAYNAARQGTISDLPTGPADAAGRGNLRITQFHGTGTAPGNYSGWAGVGPATVLINPGLANVVWNSTTNLWEVTCSVTGFSGFYVTGLTLYSLPLQLESFTGTRQGNEVMLNWFVSEETNLSHYEIEISSDGIHFNAIKYITATNTRTYKLLYNNSPNGSQYYRLKMIDNDGRYVYSNVIAIDVSRSLNTLQVSPNPFKGKLQVQVEVTKRTNTVFIMTDLNGKVLLKQRSTLTQGNNTITLDQLNRLTKGTYMLTITNDEMNKTLKVIKAA